MEKLKGVFKNKKIENMFFILILLIATLMIINNILDDEKNIRDYENETNVELAKENLEKNFESDFETKLKNILEKIEGVSNVSVLVTYSESSSIVPLYNESENSSKTEEKDGAGGTRVTETKDLKKDVIMNNSSNVVLEKNAMPKVEGVIITAKGTKNLNTKSNIILAVEAVTGAATHKIQVFEMGD